MANGDYGFVHLELTTPDVAKAREFYAGLFGWTFTEAPMGPDSVYTMFKPQEGPGGGMVSMAGAPTMWMAYVGVDDIDAATEKARSLGAQVIRDVTEVPHTGWFSIVSDPTGASLALWEAVPRG